MKKIVKILSLIMAFVLMLSCVACAKLTDNEGGSGSSSDDASENNYTSNGISQSDNGTEKTTVKKETNKNNSGDNSGNTTVKPSTPTTTTIVKGYLLSASTPSDTYGNGMFLAYKLSDGRLLVYDGGNGSVKNFLIDALKTISGKSKPVVAAWVMTHDHGDHYGALYSYYSGHKDTISQELDVQEFWMNPMIADGYTLQSGLKEAFPNANFRRLVYGEEFMLDKIKVTVLCTPEVIPADSRNDVNTNSLVTMLTIGGSKILMTGDANEPAWDFMVKSQSKGEKYSLKCDFLQIPHHGVQNAGTTSGYNAANPKYLVIPSTVDLANWLTTSSNAGPSYSLYRKHGINIGSLSEETDNMTYWFAGCYGKSGTQDIKCFFTYKEK